MPPPLVFENGQTQNQETRNRKVNRNYKTKHDLLKFAILGDTRLFRNAEVALAFLGKKKLSQDFAESRPNYIRHN